MNKRTLSLFSLIAGVVVAGALAGLMFVTSAQADGDIRGTWELTALTSASGDVDVTGEKPVTAVIADGMIAGYSGCNSYAAPIEVNGEEVSIAPPAGTLMFCEGDQRETPYLRALSTVTSFTLNAGELTLTGEGVVLVFRAA